MTTLTLDERLLHVELRPQAGDDLPQRVNRFLATHPEVPREAFLRDALEHEIALLMGRDAAVPPVEPSQEEVRDHAWVEERLAAMRHEREGFAEKIRNLFFGHN